MILHSKYLANILSLKIMRNVEAVFASFDVVFKSFYIQNFSKKHFFLDDTNINKFCMKQSGDHNHHSIDIRI